MSEQEKVNRDLKEKLHITNVRTAKAVHTKKPVRVQKEIER